VHEDVPPPSTAVSGIPPELDALVVRATRRNPDERPQDAGEFLADLLALKGSLPVTDVTSHQTLVVPRRPEEPRAPRRSRKAVVLLVVLALLALGGGYYLGSYRWTKAPGVLTLTLQGAEQALEKKGLHAKQGEGEYSEDVAVGLVLRQDPGPGGRVRKNGTVTLHLSLGPDRRVVPRLAGKDVETARAALIDVGLEVAAKTKAVYSQTIAKGKVVGTDPPAGRRLKPETSVTLIVSKGKEPVEVPNVTGKKQDAAEKILRDAGFVVDVQRVFSDTVKVGVVAEQSPSSGTADKGSTITIKVSKGPDVVTVPDVRDMDRDQAQRVLENAGLVVQERVVVSGGPGRVLQTDPKPGRVVKRGSTVVMYVY
jgi:serine/threonine-protein kinase